MADFETMESETIAQEEKDKEFYNEDMKNCDIEKARRGRESEEKARWKKRLNDKKTATEKQKKATAGELEAAEIYLKDLQGACKDGEGDSTYEERKVARKKAQDILRDAFRETDKSGSFLQRKKVA